MKDFNLERNLFKPLITLILGFVLSLNSFSQNFIQLTDTSGTSVISGTTVTVTSFGAATRNLIYCSSTTPYNLGYLTSTGITLNSGYSFHFVPAADSVMLNFSGISNSPPYQEIVMIERNGIRYPIPFVGISNGCDAMAVLTPDGYITGCNSCGVSGWNGTIIPGPVSTLTVIDSAALNGLGGNQSLFSIFFSTKVKTGFEEAFGTGNMIQLNINSFSNEVSIISNNNNTVSFIIYDFSGRKVLQREFQNSITVGIENFTKGIYLYEVRDVNGVLRNGKFVKQ